MSRAADPFNAFVAGPENADIPTASGPLEGMSLAVKDIFAVKGQRTGGGNPDFLAESPVAARTAPAIATLLEAGARFAGRTQTEELTFSLIGHNVHFPRPVNPAAPDRFTGGSSSGSAAAVAGGLADIATASDTGGSVRAPASFCGLIGLRTTHGAISLEGAMPLAPSLDTFGWFARDAETYEKVAEVVLDPPPHPASASLGHPLPAGERKSATSRPAASPLGERTRAQRAGEGALLRPLRVAALDDLLLGPAEASEYARITAVAASVLGSPRRAPALPQTVDELYWTFRKLQAIEAWRVHGDFVRRNGARMGQTVRERFEYGRDLPAGTESVETARRDRFRREFADLLGDDGVLVMPTVPGAAPLATTDTDGQQAYREKALRLLCLSGLSAFPQITIPLGKVDGAPFGLSLLGPAGSDLALVRLARSIMGAK
jgi:amidase